MIFVDSCKSLISVSPRGYYKFIFLYNMCNLCQVLLDVDESGIIFKYSTLPAPHCIWVRLIPLDERQNLLWVDQDDL